MRLTCTSLLPPAALLVSLFASHAAHAESSARPACITRLLPTSNTIPANLPAFVIDDTGSPTTVEVTKVSGGTNGLTLGSIDDPRVPKTKLLVPATNDLLEAGATYTIAYTTKCSVSGVPDSARTSSYVAGPAVALPTTIGATANQYADGAIVIAPSPELKAFLETTHFEVFVDGASLGTTPYGHVTADNLKVDLSAYGVTVGYTSTSAPRSVCTSTAIEKHEVRLTAHVAGADTDPSPMTFSVDVDCAKPAAVPTYLPDGGGDDRGATGGDDTSGCSVGGPGPLGSLASFFMVGAGLAVLGRRRRK